MHIRTVMVVSSVILCVTHCSMERLGEVQNGDTVNIHGTPSEEERKTFWLSGDLLVWYFHDAF